MLQGTDLAEDLMLVDINIFDTILWSHSSEERGREETNELTGLQHLNSFQESGVCLNDLEDVIRSTELRRWLCD
jgi:hypothetical protein